MCLKGHMGATFESSEPLHLLRLGISVPSLHREFTDSLISKDEMLLLRSAIHSWLFILAQIIECGNQRVVKFPQSAYVHVYAINKW